MSAVNFSHSTAVYQRFHWLIALFALLTFIPFIFLRYEFHDSWAWLYWLNGQRWIGTAPPCLELGSNSYLIGRPLMTPLLCAMSVFGPEIDRVWIGKLVTLGVLIAAGALLFSTFRRSGVRGVLAPLALLSVLLLPGMILMVVMMVANVIAFATLAAVLAGYLWLHYLRDPVGGFAVRLGLSVCVFALLVFAMATYQVVAVLFFLPILVDILFRQRPAGPSELGYVVLAALTFAGAAVFFIVAHSILLHDYKYFFLTDEMVRSWANNNRSVALLAGADDLIKKFAFMGHLLPRAISLWFISESTGLVPVAWIAFAITLGLFAAVFAWQARSPWRVIAAYFTIGCFFGPFLVSANDGNGLFTLERVKVFMQVPLVLCVWWLIAWVSTARQKALRGLAAVMAAFIFVGCAVSWITILSARVIPNYMELKHIEPRLRDAVRANVREIYIIKAEDGHLRKVLGARGTEELGRITSFYFPEQMVSAIVLEIERKTIPRAIFRVEAGDGDRIQPAKSRLILDMRKFP